MAKLPKHSATAVFTLLVAATTCTFAGLQACKFRSLNGSFKSGANPGQVEFTGLDLKTRGGRIAHEFFKDVKGAVYIGEIKFTRKRDEKQNEIFTNNASFFEGKAIAKVLADLEKSLQPGQTPQHFAFNGCKKERSQEIWDAIWAPLQKDKSDIIDAFVANYNRIWRTEDLDSDKTRECLQNLLGKDQLEFSFFVKQPDTNGKSKQLLIVRAGLMDRPAVFESLQPIPDGDVIVILRNDSWGKAKPKVAILPSTGEFNEKQQKDAYFAQGWPGWTLPIRENPAVDALLQGSPKTLADLSARFAALSHYGDIGGAAAKGTVGALIFWGFGMAATATPAIVHAISAAMTTHTFTMVQFAPVVPFTAGVSSAIKGICDLSNVNEKARMDNEGGVWQRREKYCFIMDLIFGVTTAAQAVATTPMVQEALRGAFNAALAQAPGVINLVPSTNPQMTQDFMSTADRYARDIDAQLNSFKLGLTNLQALGYATARTLFNAVENISSKLVAAVGVHTAIESVDNIKSFLERSGYRCNAQFDLQQLKLGNNIFTRMLAWPGCFKFLRAAYIGKGDRAGAIDDEKLWRDFAATDPLNEGPTKPDNVTPGANGSAPDPIVAADERAIAAGARLKQIITGREGKAVLLRSDAEEPWTLPRNRNEVFNELGRKIWQDIEACGMEVRTARDANPELNLCGPKKSEACLYTCARSALHQIRNTYFPIEYLYCLETKAAGTTQSCTFKHDLASDDGKSLPVAVKSGIADAADELTEEDSE